PRRVPRGVRLRHGAPPLRGPAPALLRAAPGGSLPGVPARDAAHLPLLPAAAANRAPAPARLVRAQLDGTGRAAPPHPRGRHRAGREPLAVRLSTRDRVVPGGPRDAERGSAAARGACRPPTPGGVRDPPRARRPRARGRSHFSLGRGPGGGGAG